MKTKYSRMANKPILVLLIPLLWSAAPASSAQAQNLFVTTYSGNIIEITPGGAQSTFASGLINPQGLAFDSAGNLFVASFVNGGNILEFTPGGTQSTFASGLPGPIALAFNSAGNLLVTTYSGNIFEIGRAHV